MPAGACRSSRRRSARIHLSPRAKLRRHVDAPARARSRPFPSWTWGVVLFLLCASAISVAAFIDACNTDARAHDRAIYVAGISFGFAVFIALWGRVGRWAWLAPALAVAVGIGAVLLLDRLQFGACLT